MELPKLRKDRSPGIKLLFVALAGVMYATRNVDWGAVGRRDEAEGA